MLAARVVEHLELSGFEMDEADQVLRRRLPAPLHRTPGERCLVLQALHLGSDPHWPPGCEVDGAARPGGVELLRGFAQFCGPVPRSFMAGDVGAWANRRALQTRTGRVGSPPG